MLSSTLRRPLCAAPTWCRRLGSWEAKFTEARASGATLAMRKALGDELQDVFKVEMDVAEAKAENGGAAKGHETCVTHSTVRSDPSSHCCIWACRCSSQAMPDRTPAANTRTTNEQFEEAMSNPSR